MPASSAKQGALLKEYLYQWQKYGKTGYKELENGRIRYYDKLKPSKVIGEMAGLRRVREWDPSIDLKKTWLETLDPSGQIRQVRPQTVASKTHYVFDRSGKYEGTR